MPRGGRALEPWRPPAPAAPPAAVPPGAAAARPARRGATGGAWPGDRPGPRRREWKSGGNLNAEGQTERWWKL